MNVSFGHTSGDWASSFNKRTSVAKIPGQSYFLAYCKAYRRKVDLPLAVFLGILPVRVSRKKWIARERSTSGS